MNTTTSGTPQFVRAARSVPPEETVGVRRRPWLAAYAALLALGALAGASGLAAGFVALPEALQDRLPFGSPVVGGLALALVVGVPACVLTAMAWRGHPWVLHAAVLDGLLLTGWIGIEVAFLREIGMLHVMYLAVAAGLVVWGRSAIPDMRSSASGSSRDRTRTLDVHQLPVWRPPVAYSLLAFAAVGYAAVAMLLALADARDTRAVPAHRRGLLLLLGQLVLRAHDHRRLAAGQ